MLNSVLPVESNICKWRMSEDAKYNTCQEDKDIINALVTCKLNFKKWAYVTWLIKTVFHKHIVINIDLLIKKIANITK